MTSLNQRIILKATEGQGSDKLNSVNKSPLYQGLIGPALYYVHTFKMSQFSIPIIPPLSLFKRQVLGIDTLVSALVTFILIYRHAHIQKMNAIPWYIKEDYRFKVYDEKSTCIYMQRCPITCFLHPLSFFFFQVMATSLLLVWTHSYVGRYLSDRLEELLLNAYYIGVPMSSAVFTGIQVFWLRL